MTLLGRIFGNKGSDIEDQVRPTPVTPNEQRPVNLGLVNRSDRHRHRPCQPAARESPSALRSMKLTLRTTEERDEDAEEGDEDDEEERDGNKGSARPWAGLARLLGNLADGAAGEGRSWTEDAPCAVPHAT